MPATSDTPPFEGVGVALITLFRDDGQVDFDGTAAQAELPPDLVKRIEANGHAFRDMD